MGRWVGGSMSAGAPVTQLHLNGLCEVGKANLGTSNPGLSNIKYSVVVGHEGTPQGPELDVLSPPDAASASVSACKDWTEVEAPSHGELLATEVEGNVREYFVARETEQSIVFRSRTRDQVIQVFNLVEFTDDNVSSLWENVGQAV
jgi:hypothetical protein